MVYEEIFKWLATIISGLALWVVKSQLKRIESLEEKIEEKLDKEDYNRGQQATRDDIRDLRLLVTNLPQQIVTLIRDVK